MKSFLALALLVLATATGIDAWRELSAPMSLQAPTLIDVPRGAALRQLLAGWQQQGLFRSARQARYLALYSRLTGKDTSIKSGEFELLPGTRAVDLVSVLVAGRAVLHELRVIEGWRFQDMLKLVLADPRLEHVQPRLDPASVMAALGQAGQAPEGRFFPDTYRFPRQTSDLAILRQAFQAMEQVVAGEWDRRASDIPLQSRYEALIMASIIERETGLASERADISGVFTRRLRLGMRLQTDPTVIYGMGDAFDGNIRRRDLQQDTPFNTYTRKGLPPTPICLPGRDSIRAAVNPADGDTLFFVARGDGSHQFSATVEEHNAAVRKFQLGRKSS